MPSRIPFGPLAAAALLLGAGASFGAIFETPLFTVKKVVGEVRIEKPDGTTDLVRPDYSYPYDSVLVVPATLPPASLAAARRQGVEPEKPWVSIALANDFRFVIGEGSRVRVQDGTTGDGDMRTELKILDIETGSVRTAITAAVKKHGGTKDAEAEANLAAIVIRTPVGECTRLSQRNEVSVRPDPSVPGYYNCRFFSQPGQMEISGNQYRLDEVHRNTAILIDGNDEVTSIEPESGEFTGNFERGLDENGQIVMEKVFFKSHTVAKVWRRHVAVGGRLAISVMASFPDGSRKSYVFLEGQKNVGTMDGSPADGPVQPADAPNGDDAPADSGSDWGSSDSGSAWGSSDSGSDWGSSDSDGGSSDAGSDAGDTDFGDFDFF